MFSSLRVPRIIVVAMLAWMSSFFAAFGRQENGDGIARASDQSEFLVPIEFPLTLSSEAKLRETLERVAGRAAGTERPVIILEFTGKKEFLTEANDETIGRGTEFIPALGLARWLSGPKGSRVRSVAYIPSPICGHAVLVALACEEIAIASKAEIGRAGIDEPGVDKTIEQAYQDIANRRGAFPPAAVLSLLDPLETLYQVELRDKKTDFTTASQLEEKTRSGAIISSDRISNLNQMAVFTGSELRTKLRWVAHEANDREQLERVLKLSKLLTEQQVFAGPRVMTRLHLKGIVSGRQVTRIIRAIEEGLSSPETNLILLDVDSPGGNLNESIRLANYLAGIPAERAEVVSYISGTAKGDAALIPLASDLILMSPSAKLGGAGEATISPATCDEKKLELQELAKLIGRSEGALLGCLCSEIEIFEYITSEGNSQLNNPGWLTNDPMPLWTQLEKVDFSGGLTFEKANSLGLASDNPISLEAVANKFGIDKLPPETRTNATEQFVEWLGGQGWLSMLLFVVGIISLSAELSTPGMGVAGILSAICFLLFFWIHLFQGTVEWLEILLILAGVVCLAAELFILPGFGVFGITGLILLATGLLLAGQTFVIPTNEYQWNRTAQGIGQLGFIAMSMFVAAVLFRKQLARLPMVRWFALQPPPSDVDLIDMEHAVEELRTFIGWHGTTVSRCNPSGKASIGDRIFSVASNGAWIDEDTEVEVVDLRKNLLIVKPR